MHRDLHADLLTCQVVSQLSLLFINKVSEIMSLCKLFVYEETLWTNYDSSIIETQLTIFIMG